MIRTMKGALKRIAEQADRIKDLEDQNRIARAWGTQNAEESRRLGRLLTYRAKVGDALASCPHANKEVGAISENTYCTDCGDTLIEVNRHLPREIEVLT